MTRLERWLRFNGVGIMGAALQLSSVALLHRFAPRHYMLESLLALEITLLHNFLWHRRWTWQNTNASWPQSLLRFHLTNGLVSCVGNLVLMPILVSIMRCPPVIAAAMTIIACSLINFAASERWVFASASPLASRRRGEVSC
ncbi:GtrA family protein [Granulicella cerasi]|uniref:GtrA family protein n=1 Tax=Granulicella cerasi TaxID=741063 RepID=A0ABW1Z5A3_9BACT|nr:GtrA family protein [Granulicella cerasi]